MNKSPLDWALYYASLGWPVFPIHTPITGGGCSCNKQDCSIGKHPRTPNGFKDATTDPLQIKQWWSQWPDANIGIATGKKSNLIIIDIDSKHSGEDSWDEYCKKNEKLPNTPMVLTGGGGVHYYFSYDPAINVSCKVGWLTGVDIRCEGGYVVAPPSRHASGRSYVWEVESEIGEIPLAPIPEWLIKELIKNQNTSSKNISASSSSEKIPEGQRNFILASLAGSMRAKSFSEKAIFEALLVTNQEKCEPPLDKIEVQRIAYSIGRYSPGKPKSPESPEWDDPIFFNQKIDLLTLDQNCMPPKLYEVFREISEKQKVPLELPYSYGLPIISTALGNKVLIKFPTHEEVVPLWMCCIMEPGSRKSPSLVFLNQPILDEQKRLTEEDQRTFNEWVFEKKFYEEEFKKIKKENKQAILEGMEKYQYPPTERHIWTNDATPQSLVKLICENKSIGILSAEASPIFESFGQYSNSRGNDLGIWLSGHAGDSIKSTRVGRRAYSTDRAILSVGVASQIEPITRVTSDPMLSGRGFCDRFAFFLPRDPRGFQTIDEKIDRELVVSQHVLENWSKNIKKILHVQSELKSIGLGVDAGIEWKNFANEIQVRMRPDGDLRSIAGWAGKLAGLCGRICIAYHAYCHENFSDILICLDTLRFAINACRVMIDHFKQVQTIQYCDYEMKKAVRVISLLQNKRREKIKPSDLSKNGWANCKNVEEARKLLSVLTQRNFVRPISENTPRPTEYAVNPKIYSDNSGNSDTERTCL